MIEDHLDMSLDEIIAKGAKKQSRVPADKGKRARAGERPQGSRMRRQADTIDSMDIEKSAPKKISITIQNSLKPQGGTTKKKSTPIRSSPAFTNAVKSIDITVSFTFLFQLHGQKFMLLEFRCPAKVTPLKLTSVVQVTSWHSRIPSIFVQIIVLQVCIASFRPGGTGLACFLVDR